MHVDHLDLLHVHASIPTKTVHVEDLPVYSAQHTDEQQSSHTASATAHPRSPVRWTPGYMYMYSPSSSQAHDEDAGEARLVLGIPLRVIGVIVKDHTH